ncbi:MAG: menaquinone biosynthesis protein [Planctomycetes bacterium]|nr:menaquinone biosynthesis protein [Planctomycetota bacterium]
MSLLVEQPAPSARDAAAATRLGVVQYLNTLPLIAGLDHLRGLHLRRDVPASLFGRLAAGEVDAALCSSIDYQRSEEPMIVLPCGLLGCDGETLTVRLYSRKPLKEMRSLAADAESHTSRVLAAILLEERFGVRPETVDLSDAQDPGEQRHWPLADGVLLIGDKAVLSPPPMSEFPHQLDLGAAWKEWTGLPFTFAIWMAPSPRNPESVARLQTLSSILDHQRRRNASRIDCIAANEAVQRGWEAAHARRYLGELLRYAWTPSQQQGLERFWFESRQRGLTPACRPLAFLGA